MRLIDDFSICCANAAYGVAERLRVQSIDELTSYLAYILDVSEKGQCPQLLGRTLDLKHAYQQCGVDEWRSKLLKIAINDPKGTFGLFDVFALPFGASGSVTSFLRIASSLTFIGIHGLDIAWTCFFDDFSLICEASEKTNVGWYIESLFKVLGVAYADSGDKAPPFSSSFRSLGLVVNVSDLHSSRFSLEHTAQRLEELQVSLVELATASRIMPKELERLHGRLVWFGSFVFGRQMNSLVRELSMLARKTGPILGCNVF